MAHYRRLHPDFTRSMRDHGICPRGRAGLVHLMCLSNQVGLFKINLGACSIDLLPDDERIPPESPAFARISASGSKPRWARGLGPAQFAIAIVIRDALDEMGWLYDDDAMILYIPTWWRWNFPRAPNNLVGALSDFDDFDGHPFAAMFVANDRYLKQTKDDGTKDFRKHFRDAMAGEYVPHGAAGGQSGAKRTRKPRANSAENGEFHSTSGARTTTNDPNALEHVANGPESTGSALVDHREGKGREGNGGYTPGPPVAQAGLGPASLQVKEQVKEPDTTTEHASPNPTNPPPPAEPPPYTPRRRPEPPPPIPFEHLTPRQRLARILDPDDFLDTPIAADLGHMAGRRGKTDAEHATFALEKLRPGGLLPEAESERVAAVFAFARQHGVIADRAAFVAAVPEEHRAHVAGVVASWPPESPVVAEIIAVAGSG